ncbi:hypothetical protein ACNI3Q_01610 [Sphingomonas sp. FW199]|uniref:hypothetical protein n=1 Tax=Sphingomonas sp. FW199 TaxID=3400217 RepID=UPI003CEE7A8A
MARRDMAMRQSWLAIAGITLAGLVLRLLSARGGLWLDEAWSARLAHDVGTPLGIFFNINHDNSHHLNSLWLQTVGLGAPSWLARLPAIVTGTLAIPVAAMIAAPRGRWPMIATAILFALSPILVTMGSEARGYAPMALAFLTAILLVDRWLARSDAAYRPQIAIALCCFLGIFSQMTMLFGIVALGGWVFFALWQRGGPESAFTGSLTLFWPALLATLLALAIIAGAAAADPRGFQFGSYEPFDLKLFLHGIIEMFGYTIGWPFNSLWLLPLVGGAVIVARSAGASRMAFYRLAILAFPAMLALLQSGNVGHPRYYLVAGIALLLMLGEMTGRAIASGGWRRTAGAGALIAMLVGAMVQNVELIRNRRADPAVAIAVLKQRSPAGTRLYLERPTADAMVEVAAAQARYPVTLQHTPCPAAPFILADRYKGERFPASMTLCGGTYRPIAGRIATGMSGTHWRLYQRQGR